MSSTSQTGGLGLERKWWVLAAVGVGTFMSALDGSVVNTVVPVIMRSYGIELASAEWIVMIYLLIVSSLLLTFGRLGDLLGHKRVYLAGFGIFVVGSVLCGLSPSSVALIAARGLQAVGSAMLFANSPAILTIAFPGRQRGQALGMLGMFTYLGLVAGPSMGGYLTDQLGWRSIFFINVPIGIVASILAYAMIPKTAAVSKGESFDPTGALTFSAGLTSLLLALSHGQSWGWLSPIVLGLLALAAVLLAIFVLVELRVNHPMLDLSLFRNRTFAAATASALLNYMSVYSVFFLLPFYLIQYRGFTPGHAGLLITAQALTMAAVTPISGWLSDRVGSRIPAVLGMSVLTLGLASLSTVDETTDAPGLIARLMVIGLGVATFTSPNSSAIMGAAPRQRQGIASAVVAAARNVGMVLGVAYAGAIFAASLAASGDSIGANPGFLAAFRATFIAVAAVSAIGAATAWVRGRRASGTLE